MNNGEMAAAVSVSPSPYSADPTEVLWKRSSILELSFKIRNFCNEASLEVYLASVTPPPTSWEDLLARLTDKCPSLLLSPEIIRQLPTTFYPNVAERALVLFGALDEISRTIMEIAKENDITKRELLVAKRDELIGKWMTGGNARMSNSSKSEIDEFWREMTFKHPETGKPIACYWHAKIQTPQYRIHFEWPKAEAAERLFVGYFGEKITKR